MPTECRRQAVRRPTSTPTARPNGLCRRSGSRHRFSHWWPSVQSFRSHKFHQTRMIRYSQCLVRPIRNSSDADDPTGHPPQPRTKAIQFHPEWQSQLHRGVGPPFLRARRPANEAAGEHQECRQTATQWWQPNSPFSTAQSLRMPQQGSRLKTPANVVSISATRE